jgi:hypothetical protein
MDTMKTTTTHVYKTIFKDTKIQESAVAEVAEIFPSELSKWKRNPNQISAAKQARVRRSILLLADLVRLLSHYPGISLNYKDPEGLRQLVSQHWKTLQAEYKDVTVTNVLG